jgi:broad-specificity NMP kinase
VLVDGTKYYLLFSWVLKVSEGMYKEYDQLRQQYELETGTLQKAMERASQVSICIIDSTLIGRFTNYTVIDILLVLSPPFAVVQTKSRAKKEELGVNAKSHVGRTVHVG